MSYVLGIDVGVTRTAAAIGRPGGGPGSVEVVTLSEQSATVASDVLSESGAASDDVDQLARLVRWVGDRAAQQAGGPADRVALAHPATWGAHEREGLAAALAQHGCPVTLIAAPLAAATAYAAVERVQPGALVAVYDLGGTNFDAAVVRREPGGTFSVVGRPEHVDALGGNAFDDALLARVTAAQPAAFADLDAAEPGALAAVRSACTAAKEALSSDTEATIPVPLPGGAVESVTVPRAEFEALIRSELEQSVAALRRTISSAGRPAEQLAAVLLVGGSSRIPLATELAAGTLGRTVTVDPEPETAVARGAALCLLPAPAPTWSGAAAPVRTGASTAMGAASTGAASIGAATMGAASIGGTPSGVASTGAGASTGIGTGIGAGTYAPHRAAQLPPDPPEQSWTPAPQHGPSGAFPSGAGHASWYGPEWARPDSHATPDRSVGGAAKLVAAGGATAALAIVAMAFLWPHDAVRTTPAGVEASLLSAPPAAPTPEPTPEPQPTRTRRAEPTKAAPPPPPVVTKTVAPVTNTPAPSTTASATASPTPKPTSTSAPTSTPKPTPQPKPEPPKPPAPR